MDKRWVKVEVCALISHLLQQWQAWLYFHSFPFPLSYDIWAYKMWSSFSLLFHMLVSSKISSLSQVSFLGKIFLFSFKVEWGQSSIIHIYFFFPNTKTPNPPNLFLRYNLGKPNIDHGHMLPKRAHFNKNSRLQALRR